MALNLFALDIPHSKLGEEATCCLSGSEEPKTVDSHSKASEKDTSTGQSLVDDSQSPQSLKVDRLENIEDDSSSQDTLTEEDTPLLRRTKGGRIVRRVPGSKWDRKSTRGRSDSSSKMIAARRGGARLGLSENHRSLPDVHITASRTAWSVQR
jgi:hypothetical protein